MALQTLNRFQTQLDFLLYSFTLQFNHKLKDDLSISLKLIVLFFGEAFIIETFNGFKNSLKIFWQSFVCQIQLEVAFLIFSIIKIFYLQTQFTILKPTYQNPVFLRISCLKRLFFVFFFWRRNWLLTHFPQFMNYNLDAYIMKF